MEIVARGANYFKGSTNLLQLKSFRIICGCILIKSMINSTSTYVKYWICGNNGKITGISDIYEVYGC
jgi:hypothetical protein